MSRSELHKLNLKHEKTLKRLKKASNHKAKGNNSLNLLKRESKKEREGREKEREREDRGIERESL